MLDLPPSELIHRSQRNESGDGIVPELRLDVHGCRQCLHLASAQA